MKSNAENEKNPTAKTRGVSSADSKKSAVEIAPGEERLQKLLSRAGVASRRAAEKLIADGQVAVNGHIVKELGAKADPAVDKITVSGRPLLLNDAAPTVVLLHKPRGFMTTKNDPEGRPIVLDLLPKKLQKLNPVGRLDFDTSGVLLLTDDGDLLHLLTHPSHGVEKVYHARVGGQVKLEVVKLLEGGVYISEGDEHSKTKIKTAPCRVRVRAQTDKNALVEVTLREGRNRQVRKMLETMGHAVSSLRRIKFAGLELDELPSGGYRLLLPGEIHALRKAATRVIAKKQSRDAVLKEAAQAQEAKARRAPRPKTPTKFVSRGKSSSRDADDSREEASSRSRPDKGSTPFTAEQPSRSTYGTKNQSESTFKPRAAGRVSSYEASGQEKPRANSSSRSASESPKPRTSAPRTGARASSYKSAGEDKPHDYSSSRSASSPNARPRNPAPRTSAPRTPTPRPTASSRKPTSAKPEAPLGERIRRQWKND